MKIDEILKSRILILDGAMGTMIQRYKLTEEGYRGERFKDVAKLQKGNNDLLCITQPEIIEEIHCSYLAAGADIIETNTFNANAISMEDYGMSPGKEINASAVRIARKAQVYCMIRINPFCGRIYRSLQSTASMSPDVENPMYRAVTSTICVMLFRADRCFGGGQGGYPADRDDFRYP